MKAFWYLLDENNNIVPTNDLFAVEKLFEDRERRQVGLTDVNSAKVSTVFLCVNMQHVPGQTPLLFETAIINEKGIILAERYHNWEAAETGHDKWVKKTKDEKVHMFAMAKEVMRQNTDAN